jgi:hypothetical protein
MSNKISLEVVNFEKEMKRIREEVELQGVLGTHELMDYATEQLRIVTPVKTGKARSGWVNEKYSARMAFRAGVGVIKNDVEYIEYLNQGSSKQAPRYFIEKVLSTIGVIS